MSIVDYLRDTRAEFKHVTWPTRRQAVAFTVAVVIISVGLSIILGIADTAFSYILKLITLR